ncbi:MAG: four helix bundle protein [Bacteroidales bacterium]|nr:four helix bundle protein [Bacteroidales bacterium]
MEYSFENLEVWQIALDLSDIIYKIADDLPSSEKFNLCSQIIRAGTSISLNIAEGSICITAKEKKKFLRISLHSLVEVIACVRLIERREYSKLEGLSDIEEVTNKLFAKLNAFIKSIKE